MLARLSPGVAQAIPQKSAHLPRCGVTLCSSTLARKRMQHIATVQGSKARMSRRKDQSFKPGGYDRDMFCNLFSIFP